MPPREGTADSETVRGCKKGTQEGFHRLNACAPIPNVLKIAHRIALTRRYALRISADPFPNTDLTQQW
jgi:hypothetical protein